MMDRNQPLVEFVQVLADPLRLAMLQHLMGDSATVSELMALTGATQSNVSNHLALLRERGFVRATRQGRQVVYELRNLAVAQLIESLTLVAGGVPTSIQQSPPLIRARTCYDHLAGRLGVALFDALVAQGALNAPDAGERLVEPGPAGKEVFARLGLDLPALRRARRRFATACIDWTERRPHLGGALGAAIWAHCLESGWIIKQPGERSLIITSAGEQGFKDQFGIEIKEGHAE
jgi:DNA-binding transcriptional ArsR family regulator